MSVVKDKEFWREVYYYMEEHNCYMEEAVQMIIKKRKSEELTHAM
ncbi:hypothetical protein ACQVPW_26010 [Bacillus cereus]|nr:hypothetical protein RE438_12045 [Bacillus wiedmannii]